MTGGSAYPLERSTFTDLYELTMLQAYVDEGMDGPATFSLFVRTLPPTRNFLVAAGLEQAIEYLEGLRFSATAVEYIASLGLFRDQFLDWLADFHFSGSVVAVPEGTPVFAGEPLLEVDAPLPEAQLIETYLLNQVTFQTLIASKGARVVAAADGRPVMDFGARRTHGIDAALMAARALHIVGFEATSNVEAGRQLHIPVAGTMAHSYIQAHDVEDEAFVAFSDRYESTVLLIDTYDVARAAEAIVQLVRDGRMRAPRAVRLDSGDLEKLACEVRSILDAGGCGDVGIVASGGLDERDVARLVEVGAPFDSYAVGTMVGTSADQPTLDSVYKLVAYGGSDRSKASAGKVTPGGARQIVRRFADGVMAGDTVCRRDQQVDGAPLLVPVMSGGRRIADAVPSLGEIREYCAAQIKTLPERLRSLERADPGYPVDERLAGSRD